MHREQQEAFRVLQWAIYLKVHCSQSSSPLYMQQAEAAHLWTLTDQRQSTNRVPEAKRPSGCCNSDFRSLHCAQLPSHLYMLLAESSNL